jgi:hypothetical protein
MASEPDWMNPITTVTPRLVNQIRYDQFQQFLGNGAEVNNYFGGKALELIPTTTNEILINIPAFEQRKNVKPATGFADWNFLTVKQRLLSANEENGNYILTAFLGFQAPTGVPAFTNKAWIVTPTIAGGIGFGDFDIQGTIGVPIPTANEHAIGTSIVSSLTLQYHIAPYFWPEFAFNDHSDRPPLRRPRQPHEPDACEQARRPLPVLCVACDFAESKGRSRQHRPRAGPRD